MVLTHGRLVISQVLQIPLRKTCSCRWWLSSFAGSWESAVHLSRSLLGSGLGGLSRESHLVAPSACASEAPAGQARGCLEKEA